jgi:hypothetical protein
MARPKSEIKREQRGLRLRSDVMTALGHLSVDLRIPLNVLVEEAALDLLAKHGRRLETADEGQHDK